MIRWRRRCRTCGRLVWFGRRGGVWRDAHGRRCDDWLEHWACYDAHARKGGYEAADVPVSAMGPLPDVLTRPGAGQKSPRGTARPPLVTTQQETPPPPSVHACCHRCDPGN